MRKLLVALFLSAAGSICQAQTNYDVNTIPKDLLPYSSAVIRNEEVTMEVKDLDNTTYHVKKAITVLNKNGENMAEMVIFYNKNTPIKYIRGTAVNEFGKLIKKFGERDFEDQSAVDNSTLFDDERVKHYIPAITEYPYTIEYEYEQRYKQTLYFNNWIPNPGFNVAVENSSLRFICKPDFNINYKEINLPTKAEIGSTKEGLKTYSWNIHNLKAVKGEPLSPDWHKYLSGVIIAPEKFMYFGMAGSFTNWQQLGKWEYDKLLSNRSDISPETGAYIKQLTAGITDPKQKAKKIYEYMQQKTHYISIQVGIGGFQPFLASEVDKQNYGDCKALANYMHSLLKTVDIDSWYCVVQAGREHKESLMRDFTSMNQGNHIILCLPFKNDTTWLECTSQTIPFGFLSDFTDDRNVLACTPEGGKLLHTPKYVTEENAEVCKARFDINESGNLTGTMETSFKGTEYDDREWMINESQTERVKDIKRLYPINNLDIEKLEYKQDKSVKPVTIEKIKLTASEYGSINGGKFYFTLNSIDRAKTIHEVRNRLNPVDIVRGHTEEDEIVFTIPKGYRLDSEPLKRSINRPFGSFHVTMTVDGDQIKYTRKFQVKDGTYSKDVYEDMVNFYQEASDADNYVVSLVKN